MDAKYYYHKKNKYIKIRTRRLKKWLGSFDGDDDYKKITAMQALCDCISSYFSLE